MFSLHKGVIYNHTEFLPMLGFNLVLPLTSYVILCKLINFSNLISSPANQDDNSNDTYIFTEWLK